MSKTKWKKCELKREIPVQTWNGSNREADSSKMGNRTKYGSPRKMLQFRNQIVDLKRKYGVMPMYDVYLLHQHSSVSKAIIIRFCPREARMWALFTFCTHHKPCRQPFMSLTPSL
jgi:hypothetical protein